MRPVVPVRLTIDFLLSRIVCRPFFCVPNLIRDCGRYEEQNPDKAASLQNTTFCRQLDRCELQMNHATNEEVHHLLRKALANDGEALLMQIIGKRHIGSLDEHRFLGLKSSFSEQFSRFQKAPHREQKRGNEHQQGHTENDGRPCLIGQSAL